MKSSSFTVRQPLDKIRLIQWLDKKPMPFTTTITEGEKRSNEQNRLQFLWMKEAEQQGDMTANQYRALCKLTIGIPILRHEDEDFRERYDVVFKGLPYDQKLSIIELMDFPVTSLMTTKQKTKYLDRVHNFLSVDCGLMLTEPNQPPLEMYA